MAARTTSIFTIGYEGKTLAQFIDELRRKRISRVVDVRELPLSRRKGFSKTPLAAALASASIDYVHIRAAGNPFRHLRDDLEACLGAYGARLDAMPEIVDVVIRAAAGRRSALLCVERHASSCHRSILGAKIAASTSAPIVDL
jgi:uncharacterized protein (DUF488 family)